MKVAHINAGFGSNGSGDVVCIAQNEPLLHSGNHTNHVVSLAFDTNNTRSYPSMPRAVSPRRGKVQHHVLTLPRDAKAFLTNGRVQHLNFNPQYLLDGIDHDSGCALHPAMGQVVRAVNGDAFRSALDAGISEVSDPQGTGGSYVELHLFLFTGGGSAPALLVEALESLAQISAQASDTLMLSTKVFMAFPSPMASRTPLSHRQRANTVALLREIAALWYGAQRYARIDASGLSQVTNEALRFEMFVFTEHAQGIAQPPRVTACRCRVPQWLSAEHPLGRAFKAKRVDFIGQAGDPGVPTVYRVGAASIFAVVAEQGVLLVALTDRALLTGLRNAENAPPAAADVLYRYGVAEDRTHTQISTYLGDLGKDDPLASALRAFPDQASSAAELSPQVQDIQNAFYRIENENRVRWEAKVEPRARARAEEMAATAQAIAEELIRERGPAVAQRVLQDAIEHMDQATQENEAVIAVHQDQRLRCVTRAQQLYERSGDYDRASKAERSANAAAARQVPDQVKAALLKALKLSRGATLKKHVAPVLQCLLEELKKQKDRVDELLAVLIRVERSVDSRLRALQRTDWEHRGFGIAFPTDRLSWDDREHKGVLGKVEATLMRDVRAALAVLVRPESGQLDAAALDRAIWTHCEKHLASAGALDLSADVAAGLVEHADRDEILARAISLATETSAADELSQQSGGHLMLVGIEGGENSSLQDPIVAAARAENEDGEVHFVDTDNPTEIVFLRLEAGVPATALKLLAAWEKEYEAMGDDRFLCHLDPLWSLMPSIFARPRHEHRHELFVYGLLAGAVQEDEEGVFCLPLSGERVTADTPEKLAEQMAQSLRLWVDVASRFAHRVREEGFDRVSNELKAVTDRLQGQPWAPAIQRVEDDIRTIRRLYHQA